ncbi:MAG: peptidase MA family metallohydrolase [Acidobacteriota bacterium]|nr:peptidase MA family metallohydrolase [Acidobacteriota bacterium]
MSLRPILSASLLPLSSILAVVCLFPGSSLSAADTITLKNGRTIVADRVHEKGNQVEYEIGDNTYAILKSSVASVSAGGTPAVSAPATQVPEVPVAEPSDRLPDLTNKVVRDGAVDADALAAIEQQGDTHRSAAAYYAAGRFEHIRGNAIRGADYMKEAARLDPGSSLILEHYATLLMACGRPADALTYAEQAVRVTPKSADTQNVLGYALYQNDRTKDAVAAWKRSLELRPNERTEAMMARAERELAAEHGYDEQASSHFTMRYEGTRAPAALRRAILDVLEQHYNDLAAQFGESPHQSVVVILYTDQAFFDVTNAPAWTSALNDGKLRIPLRGMNVVSAELSRVLRHELAHSFINSLSRGHAPVWLHEGMAMLLEGRTTGSDGRILARGFASGNFIPLNGMEGSFTTFSAPEARLAYAESLAFAERINDTYGFSDLVRILQRIAEGSSTEAALRATIHSGYSDMEGEMAGYLKGKYGE